MTSSNLGETPPSAQPVFCSECGALLSDGARFCHRCGVAAQTHVGNGPSRPPAVASAVAPASAIPWGIAAVALIAVVVFAVSGRDGNPDSPASATGSARPGAPPSIASMSPSERAGRLYARVMAYAEAGNVDSVAVFAPMVMAAHAMLTDPTVDERYHYGRVAEVLGLSAIANAQADTILQVSPRSLLGLVLAARAARMDNQEDAAQGYDRRLLQSLDAELASGNEEYASHRAEIDLAVASARHRP